MLQIIMETLHNRHKILECSKSDGAATSCEQCDMQLGERWGGEVEQGGGEKE
jgi:hypothetical protein